MFEQLAAERGVSDRVRLLGSVSDSERVRLLHSSDIFALPSRAEGQPIALLEAIAAGLPVVSTTVGSIPEVVARDNGFLAAPGDVAAVANHLEALIRDATLRETMGRFNAIDGRRRYDLTRVMREVTELYAMLDDGAPAR